MLDNEDDILSTQPVDHLFVVVREVNIPDAGINSSRELVEPARLDSHLSQDSQAQKRPLWVGRWASAVSVRRMVPVTFCRIPCRMP